MQGLGGRWKTTPAVPIHLVSQFSDLMQNQTVVRLLPMLADTVGGLLLAPAACNVVVHQLL